VPEAEGDTAPRVWSSRLALMAALLSSPFLFLTLNLDTGHRPWREWVGICIPHLIVGLALAIGRGRRLVLTIAAVLGAVSALPAVGMVGLAMMFPPFPDEMNAFKCLLAFTALQVILFASAIRGAGGSSAELL
jgi:hypothetical protein